MTSKTKIIGCITNEGKDSLQYLFPTAEGGMLCTDTAGRGLYDASFDSDSNLTLAFERVAPDAFALPSQLSPDGKEDTDMLLAKVTAALAKHNHS